jgi:hypothetical protein
MSEADCAYCARCQRSNPESEEGSVPSDWEALANSDGEVVGFVCRGCITPNEQRFLDNYEMAMKDARKAAYPNGGDPEDMDDVEYQMREDLARIFLNQDRDD